MTANPLLAVLFLLGAVAGIVHGLLAWRGADRVQSYLGTPDSVVAHVVMNLGMAVMATPLYTSSARVALIAVLSALGAGFAVLLVGRRPGPRRRARRTADGYHLVAAAVMVYAVVLMPAADSGTAGMSEMDHAGTGVLGLALAALFALDAVGTAVLVVAAPDRMSAAPDRMSAAPVPAGGPTPAPLAPAARRGLRVASVGHLVMDVGMVWMLLT